MAPAASVLLAPRVQAPNIDPLVARHSTASAPELERRLIAA
jgi:hypothetical protein